jgi:hypothetical protein
VAIEFRELSTPQLKLYFATLRSSHKMQLRFYVLDGDEHIIGALHGNVVGGGVHYVSDAEIDRTLALDIVTPGLNFDWSPMGDVYADKHMKVVYQVYVTTVGWVDVPVFSGPVSHYERDGHSISLEAVGKESLMMDPVKQLAVPNLLNENETQRVDLTGYTVNGDAFTLNFEGRDTPSFVRGTNYTVAAIQAGLENLKGFIGNVVVDNLSDTGFRLTFGGEWKNTNVQKVTVSSVTGCTAAVTTTGEGSASIRDRKVASYIRRVASQYGERRFDLGAAGQRKVPKDFDIDPSKAREKGTWWYLQQIAASVNMRLFYDGRGFLCLYPHRQRDPEHRFTNTDVLTEPVVGFDLQELRNIVEVFGKDDKGHDVLKARVGLADDHPLSAVSLGRRGTPRRLVKQIKLDSTKITRARATEIAKRELDHSARQTVDVQFEALPVPHLNPGDTLELNTDEVHASFTFREGTLDLTAAPMSVGFVKKNRVARFRPHVYWKAYHRGHTGGKH